MNMKKIIKKEEYLDVNGLIYTRTLLENGEVVWLLDTTLKQIPNNKSIGLEKKYFEQIIDKEVD